MSNNFDFKIAEAVREAVPPLISLWSKSGGGKTYSALLLARGIVGPKGKIVVIDTENGRAKFYSDVAGPWHHMDLQPPFTPDKYSKAFEFCENWGADIIIVDSGSHVWEGEGGVIDAADKVGGTGLHKWNAPKMALKRMTNRLVRSAIPVIFCLRAKDAVKQHGKGKDAEIVSIGWQPIAEKNFIFEMTLDLHMTKDGFYDLSTSKTVPEGLRGVVVEGGRVTTEMGRKIAEWMGSGAAVDPEYLKLKRDGHESSMRGVAAYTEWLNTLGADQKEKIKHHHREWANEARNADMEAAASQPQITNSQGNPLDDQFTKNCKVCGDKKVVDDENGKGPCPACAQQP